jgi:hypothetical protein
VGGHRSVSCSIRRKDVPTIEEPPRLIRQAHTLARSLYALGHDDQDVDTMMRRIALDSMPAARLAVLRALVATDGPPTATIARTSGLHWYVAHRHCEDMAAPIPPLERDE